MTKLAFNEFPEVTSKQWKQKIQVDLKGADYNDTLIWNTNDGIDVRPFYHLDEMDQSFLSPNTQASQWTINQTIFVADETRSNAKAKAVSINPSKYFFLKTSIIPPKTIGIYPRACALALCPTPKIMMRYVEKPKAIAPNAANRKSTFRHSKRM